MLLWVLFAVMTAALIWVVLVPFVAGETSRDSSASAAPELMYREQLSQIDVDVERGVLNAQDAEGLRAEVARRLFQETERGGPTERVEPSAGSRGVAIAALIGVPAFAVAVYLSVGSPLLPSQPHDARVLQDSGDVRVAELVRRVEKRLATHPEDGKGWAVLAPVYMRMGRYADAAEAWRNAERLLGETPDRVIGFAEAQIYADNGIVGEDARKALVRGVALQPNYLPGAYWLAIAKEQDGKLREARADLSALLPRAGAQTPLGKSIRDRLNVLESRLRQAGAVAANSSASTSSETSAMIEGMVRSLADRLEENSNNFEGWTKLIRSYVVLRRPEQAMRALAKARKTFAGQSERLGVLKSLAQELNLES